MRSSALRSAEARSQKESRSKSRSFAATKYPLGPNRNGHEERGEEGSSGSNDD